MVVLNLKRVEEVIGILTAKRCTEIFAAGIEIEDLHQILQEKALEAAEDWNEKKPASLYKGKERIRDEKRIACILLAGVLLCTTLTAGFAKDATGRIVAADRNAGAADSIEGFGGEAYKQALEELWIDGWGSVWIGGSEFKSTLKRMAESLDAACLPTIGAVICSGTLPNAVFLDFSA